MDGLREPDAPGGVRSEEELLGAIRRGDAAAFDTVARMHSPRLFRLALRLCGKREDAEDLVQDTLLRTLPRLGGFEGRAQVSTYLVRALVNGWRNRLRSRKRSRLVDWFAARKDSRGDPAPPAEPADETPGVEERLVAGDRAAAVRGAIAQLEPTRRLALLLCAVEEMSYEEIAEMTGVPVGTVRSRLARAREDLRRFLQGRLP